MYIIPLNFLVAVGRQDQDFLFDDEPIDHRGAFRVADRFDIDAAAIDYSPARGRARDRRVGGVGNVGRLSANHELSPCGRISGVQPFTFW